MNRDELEQFDRLKREVADLRRVLGAIKTFCADCPNCGVLSKAIRDEGTSDYDVERLMRRPMPRES